MVGANEFFDVIQTEVVCERKVTERGKERLERTKKWLNEVLSKPEVLGVIGWIQLDCEDPTWEDPMFVVYVKKGMLPQIEDDNFFAYVHYYGYKGVKNSCPGHVWSVNEVDEMPEFTEEDINQICWCGIKDTFTVWTRGDLDEF